MLLTGNGTDALRKFICQHLVQSITNLYQEEQNVLSREGGGKGGLRRLRLKGHFHDMVPDFIHFINNAVVNIKP